MIDFYAIFERQIQFLYLYGLPPIFLFMFAESFFIPFPTEAVFLAVSGMVTSGKMSFWSAWTLIFSGMLTGSLSSYLLGFYGQEALVARLKKSDRIVKTQDTLHKWFAKYGPVAIIGSRLFGYIRPWSSFVIGVAKVPFKTFLKWNLIGTAFISFWDIFLAKKLIDVWADKPQYQNLISFGVFIFAFGFLIYLLFKLIYSQVKKRILKDRAR